MKKLYCEDERIVRENLNRWLKFGSVYFDCHGSFLLEYFLLQPVLLGFEWIEKSSLLCSDRQKSIGSRNRRKRCFRSWTHGPDDFYLQCCDSTPFRCQLTRKIHCRFQQICSSLSHFLWIPYHSQLSDKILFRSLPIPCRNRPWVLWIQRCSECNLDLALFQTQQSVCSRGEFQCPSL